MQFKRNCGLSESVVADVGNGGAWGGGRLWCLHCPSVRNYPLGSATTAQPLKLQ